MHVRDSNPDFGVCDFATELRRTERFRGKFGLPNFKSPVRSGRGSKGPVRPDFLRQSTAVPPYRTKVRSVTKKKAKNWHSSLVPDYSVGS